MADAEQPWQSERLVGDAIGRLIEFWGFKRNMGRLWSVLYLSQAPLSAPDLQERLGLSAGAVSMTLNELLRWGVVVKVRLEGERRDHFAAEGNIWKMVSRVLSERERAQIVDSIEVLGEALRHIDEKAAAGDAEQKARAAFERARIEDLLKLSTFGQQLLDGLLAEGVVDVTKLFDMLLGKSSDIDKKTQ